MTVSRKIFLVSAGIAAALSVLFILITYAVIQASFGAIVENNKGAVMEEVTGRLLAYYEDHGHAWDGVQAYVEDLKRESGIVPEDASVAVKPKNDHRIYVAGAAVEGVMTHLGIKRGLRLDGKAIGHWYYHDAEVDSLSKLRIGITLSVVLLLSVGTILIAGLSLAASYGIARRITAPLRRLLPDIDRLGRGEYGVQTPIVSKDEFGKVAGAFNAMSSQLQRSEQVRRNLVADVAHELRTPITIVSGKLESLQLEGSAIEPERLLPLQDELIRLSRLVGDLHQLTLAEARKLPLELAETDMADLVRRIVDHLREDAARNGVRLAWSRPGNAVKSVPVDRNRMTQVLLNLLNNAIRYTPAGGEVTIALEAGAAQGEHGAVVRLKIADTGPGIEPERLPYIFDRFYRTDEARTRHGGGMGLGLAIAKQFVLAHGGTLEAESVLGEGSVFTIELPDSPPSHR